MAMIKALILVHLWSLVVAGGAWVLQRDGDGQIGASFPAPKIWLFLVILSILPGVLYVMPVDTIINFPKIEAFELLPHQVSDSSAGGSRLLNYLTVYMCFSALLMSRTLWRWSRLQILPLMPTTEPDIFTTTSEIPPLTLSWPRRVVVVPLGFQLQKALIQHERAHLHHRDAEVTLLLLLLQDIMLRSPGISYLVRQWRLSIELRADQAATKMLTSSERKDYAALLLNVLRSNEDPTGRDTLPCPTAHLTSARHRSAKMRLTKIMENKPNPRKKRWSVSLLLTTFGASMIGLMSTAASPKNGVLNTKFDQVEYVKQTSPQMPDNCPGLLRNLKRDGIKFEEKELTFDGRLVSQHTMNLGTVILSHDVRRGGSIYNPRIISSTHPCFESEAKAAIVQWMAEPQSMEIRDAVVKLHFIISGETIKDLKLQLDDFLE